MARHVPDAFDQDERNEHRDRIRTEILCGEGYVWDADPEGQGWRSPHDDLRRSLDAAWAEHLRVLHQQRS